MNPSFSAFQKSVHLHQKYWRTRSRSSPSGLRCHASVLTLRCRFDWNQRNSRVIQSPDLRASNSSWFALRSRIKRSARFELTCREWTYAIIQPRSLLILWRWIDSVCYQGAVSAARAQVEIFYDLSINSKNEYYGLISDVPGQYD